MCFGFTINQTIFFAFKFIREVVSFLYIHVNYGSSEILITDVILNYSATGHTETKKLKLLKGKEFLEFYTLQNTTGIFQH